MTCVRFYRSDGRTTAFEATGHAGYAEEGSDIVCAAVTSAVQLTHCFLSDILGIEVKTEVDEDETRIYVEIPADISDEDMQQAENAMDALMVHMTALKEDYPDFIDVMEV